MTASTEVLTELSKANLTIEAQACLAAISEAEAYDFDILYSGGDLVDPSDTNIEMEGKFRKWTGGFDVFPTWHGATTGQLISTAAGAFQFTGTTWRFVVTNTGKSDFSPQSQIINAWWLAQYDFHRKSGFDLDQALTTNMLPMVSTYLRKTWPGGANANFPKRYASNLEALKNGPPQPPPPELIFTLDGPLTATAHDSTGKAIRVVLRGAASAILLAMFFNSVLGCSKPPERQQIAVTAPFDWSGSTFYFGKNMEIIPIRKK